MNKNFKKVLNIASIIFCGSLFLSSCEADPDNLGEQLFVGTAAQENADSYDVIAYNIDNNDSIRTDASKLLVGQLGAFEEGVFGRQKASYISQLRMEQYDPSFGTNPVVDSVVLVMKMPFNSFAADSVTTVSTSYVYPEGAVDATKEIKKYPVYKYGKTKIGGKTIFNIKVNEVTDFLKSSTDKVFSNESFATSTLLGSKVFDGDISSIKITKTADNSVLFSADPSLRIPLDAAFFQNKIIAKAGTADLKDAYNFIRYFRGVKISVDENDGYLFPFDPQAVDILMYYKKDKVDGVPAVREQKIFKLTMGTTLSTHIGQYEYNRTGTIVADALATINTTTGDKKLYPQGMGGPSFGFRIPPATIATLKSKVKDEKIGIISAKVRMYTDKSIWNNKYAKPNSFVFLQKDAQTFLAETSVLNAAPGFSLVKAYDLNQNPAYYDFTITKTLKDILEKEAANEDFIIHMGSFLINDKGFLVKYDATTRPYTPNRLVLVGTDPANDQRIQLKIIYGSK